MKHEPGRAGVKHEPETLTAAGGGEARWVKAPALAGLGSYDSDSEGSAGSLDGDCPLQLPPGFF